MVGYPSPYRRPDYSGRISPLGADRPVDRECNRVGSQLTPLGVSVAALEADLADTATIRDAGDTPNSKLDWLRGFAASLESGSVRWRDGSGTPTIEVAL